MFRVWYTGGWMNKLRYYALLSFLCLSFLSTQGLRRFSKSPRLPHVSSVQIQYPSSQVSHFQISLTYCWYWILIYSWQCLGTAVVITCAVYFWDFIHHFFLELASEYFGGTCVRTSPTWKQLSLSSWHTNWVNSSFNGNSYELLCLLYTELISLLYCCIIKTLFTVLTLSVLNGCVIQFCWQKHSTFLTLVN